MKEPFDINLKF